MIKRLRIKFVCIFMVLVTVMLALTIGLTLHLTKKGLEKESADILHSLSAPEKREEKSKKPNEKKEQKPEEKKDEKPGSEMPTFTLSYDASGELRVSGNDTFDLTDTDYLRRVLDAAIATGKAEGDLEAFALRFVRTEGGYVFADTAREHDTMQAMVRSSVLIGAVSFLAFFGISIALSFWLVKPVERAWTQQRQFIADASHELKTPLTVILTNAELLQGGDLPDEKREQCSASVVKSSRQMRSMIEEMLTLARADDAKSVELQSIDLSELMQDAILDFEVLFYERGLSLETSLAEQLCVKSEAGKLRQLLDILLDNAQKHSAAGEVRISLKKQGRHAHLSLSNPAAPISQEELAHLFERFYRLDKAHSTNGSYGLGLSIAQSLATQLGATLRADYAENRLQMTLKLPLAT